MGLSRALVLHRPGAGLALSERPRPVPGNGEVCLKVEACGVCRTDLHIVDGDLSFPGHPVILGHEVVGVVVAQGRNVRTPLGMRLGVAWLGSTCGRCDFCARGEENLCESPQFTGWQLDGGYADHVIANEEYCYELPAEVSASSIAPLMCAGLIGWRCLKLAGPGRRIGVYGFGAAAHILAQVAQFQGREVYAFVRPGDAAASSLASELGVHWVGPSTERPSQLLDAAIIFAPVGALVPLALAAIRKGGVVVCGGIHMTDIPSFPYALLWGERTIRSVANLTRSDAKEFLAVSRRTPIVTRVRQFRLEDANDALNRLRSGELVGAAVLLP